MLIKKLGLGAAIGALALVSATAASATTFPVGLPGSHFFLTNGTPTSPSITAFFYNSFGSSTTFDDTFDFTIPQNGVGSGSISTSFSSALNKLTISNLLINGVSYAVPSTSSGQSATIGGIPIMSGVMNTIEVKGFTVGSDGYAGTATFQATAVPEPATWAMMLGGLGLIGVAMRRRKVGANFAS